MKKLYIFALYFALLVLAACGENWYGTGPSGGSDVKSMRIDAESAFRKGDYKGSYKLCSLIVAKEPSSSFGYFGMAKASLWQYGVSPLSVFSILKPKEGECPFMGEDVKTRNNYLQAMRKISNSLTELDRRDSLTVLYDFHMRAREDKKWDSSFKVIIDDKEVWLNLNERLADFRRTFCGNSSNNDCSDTTAGKRRPFPLSDREYKNTYFSGILLLSSFSQWFLNIFDINKDSCLTRNGELGTDYPSTIPGWREWGCTKGSGNFDAAISVKCPRDSITGEMNVIIDSRQILDDLKDGMKGYYACIEACKKDCDTKCQDQIEDLGISDVNNKIDDFGDDFSYVEDVLNGMGLGGGGDPGDGSLKGEIDKYKAYSSFYKMGVHYDVDGDGCIDEELLDGLDNDGDWFINDNTRLAPTDPDSAYYGISPMNNCMVGNNRYRDDENWKYNKPVRFKRDDANLKPICIDPDYNRCYIPEPDSTGWVTVLNFTQIGYPNGKRYWTTNNADIKLKVMQDKDCSKYDLDYRKQNIGGCWPFYDDDKFKEYCKNARSRN